MAPRGPWADRLLFLFLTVVWGLNFVFIRNGLADSGAFWLALLRGGVGTAATAVVVTALGSWRRLDARGRRDALLLGLPNTTAFYGLLFVAAQSVLPGLAAVLTYTFPLWVAVMSPSLLGHRLTRWHYLAVGIGFGGVALIAEVWSTLGRSVSLLAIVELLGAALAWAVGTVLFQRRFHRTEMLEANAFQLIGGSVGLLVLVLLFVPLSPPTLSVPLGISLAWLGILGTAAAYTIWFTLLGRTRAATLSAYVFLVPVVALIASAFLYSERLDPIQLVGVALVFLSIYGIARTPDARGTLEEPMPVTPE